MSGKKTFKFKIPLGGARVVFILYLSNASCKNLYASSNCLTSAVIHWF